MSEMEGIVHIRIDDRLLHGQVVGFWTNTLKATRIMVPSDRVAADEMLRSVLRMAAPAGVKTSFIPVERAVRQIMEGRYAGQRVFVVCEGPADVLKMMDLGLPITKVNVGNIGGAEGRIAVKTSLSLSPPRRRRCSTRSWIVASRSPRRWFPPTRSLTSLTSWRRRASRRGLHPVRV